MKKLMLIATGVLLLISVLVMLLVPDRPIILETGGETVSLEKTDLKDKAKKADTAPLIPTPSGVSAQWIPVEEAKLFMDSSNAIVLDVRTQEEYGQGHIKGAKSIPLEDLEKRAPAELPDRWKMILIYDSGGERCLRAAKILTDKMYMNIFVFGGIKNWPYETVQ